MGNLEDFLEMPIYVEGETLRCYDLDIEADGWVGIWLRRVGVETYCPLVFLIHHGSPAMLLAVYNRCKKGQDIDDLGSFIQLDPCEHATTFLECI